MSKTEKTEDVKFQNPPMVSLEGTVKYVREVVAKGGTNGTFDDLTRAFNTSNTTSGTFFARMYALRTFGFLEIDSKNRTYRFTRIGLDLIHPDSQDGETLAIQAAFKNIATLRMIWEGYQSQVLPAKDYLPNAIGKRFAIPDDKKENWADYFLKSAIFAKLVEQRSTGLYVNSGISSFRLSDEPSQQTVNESPQIEPETAHDLRAPIITASRPIQHSQPIPRNTSEAIEELSSIMTSGNKLHRRIGNSYIMLYMDSSMTQEEAVEFQKVLEKLSEAAKTLLSMI
jgi:hypothetical protein